MGSWNQEDPLSGDLVATLAVTGRFNLSNAQWAVLEPLLPKPKKPGRPPKWTKRRLAHRGGCAGHAAGGSDELRRHASA
jgi:hypothetical protein